MLKFTEWPKTPGMASKETALSLKGISRFAGDFVLIWMKQRLRWFNLQRNRTRMSNIKETFAENLQLKISVFCTQVHVMVGQNKCKEKVPDVSDPNHNVETTCNSKLKFT